MDPARAWERYGRVEPYFGVLTDPRFEHVVPGDEAWKAFFATGEAHAANVLSIVQSELRADLRLTCALDFGCGVGRVLAGLARRADRAIGVDVAPSMLAECDANMARLGCANVTTATVTGTTLPDVGRYDFLHSYIVFQHIPWRIGEPLLTALIDGLTEGGVGAIHVLFDQTPAEAWRRWRDQHLPGWHLYNKWRQKRPLGRPPMQMNPYPTRRVLDLLRDAGCHRIHLRFTDHGGHRGAMLFFAKDRLPMM